MGSINTIWKPQYWYKILEGKSKITKDDIIYEMIIGEIDDYPTISDITILISKINYDHILDGTYIIKSHPYSENPITLYNNAKEEISLVIGKKQDPPKTLRIKRGN